MFFFISSNLKRWWNRLRTKSSTTNSGKDCVFFSRDGCNYALWSFSLHLAFAALPRQWPEKERFAGAAEGDREILFHHSVVWSVIPGKGVQFPGLLKNIYIQWCMYLAKTTKPNAEGGGGDVVGCVVEDIKTSHIHTHTHTVKRTKKT